MTTIDLYRKHKAGDISREKFLYEVRRDNNLPWITNITSYDDAVQILKNKGIITENFNLINETDFKEIADKLTAALKSIGYEVEYEPSYYGYPSIMADKPIGEGHLRVWIQPSQKEKDLYRDKYKDDPTGPTKSLSYSTVDVEFVLWKPEVVKKFFGLFKSKKLKGANFPEESGMDIDLGSGMFNIPIEDSVNKIIAVVKKGEQKAMSMIGSSAEKINEGQTKEAKADEAVKAEVKAKKATEPKLKELHVDQANPYEYRHGIAHELNQLDDYSADALEKAKATVLKNLAKDANFYSNLLNQQQSPFEFKKSETDAKGMQARPDGHMKKEAKKDEKANVKDNLGKKEAGKVKPKGVKVMPDKGVEGKEKTIKEGVIKENDFEPLDILDAVSTDWGVDSDLYQDLHDIISLHTDRSGNIDQDGIEEIRALLSNWDVLDDYSHFLDDTNSDDNLAPIDRMYNSDAWVQAQRDAMEEGSFMGGVDLGGSFEKMKSSMGDEAKFEDLMKKYDWYAEMSDDSRKYDAQKDMEYDLKALSKSIGAEKATEIWNRHAPEDRKIQASFFMREGKLDKIKEELKTKVKEAVRYAIGGSGKTKDKEYRRTVDPNLEKELRDAGVPFAKTNI